jgi:cation transport regulator ChaC
MTLHFAYGSNMSRAAMKRRCPSAVALGPAILDGWRFVIGIGGHGSIEPESGSVVHGVLWRLASRDLAAINAYEGVDTGVYLRRTLPVRHGRHLQPALVYIVRRPGHGTPRPAYIRMIVEAAQAWKLPQSHVRSLQRWSTCRLAGARAKETGEVG